MKKTLLPILRCSAICPSCKMPTEIPQFESGFGGDFSTYIGETTGAIYRVKLDSVKYGHKSLEEILSWAANNENGRQNLRALPEEVKCKICGLTYKADHRVFDKEEFAEVYDLQ